MGNGGFYDLFEEIFGKKIDDGIEAVKEKGKAKIVGAVGGALNTANKAAKDPLVGKMMAAAARAAADHWEQAALENGNEKPVEEVIVEPVQIHSHSPPKPTRMRGYDPDPDDEDGFSEINIEGK